MLCGGKGSRLNGEDKPLLRLGSSRIVDHVCHRLHTQVSSIVISCSRNVAIYEGLDHRICVDREDESGPLAGLNEAFTSIDTEWVLTTPGDTPFIAWDLVQRLNDAAEDQGIAVPLVGEFRQNLCLLINRKRRKELCDFFSNGGLAVKDWLDSAEIEPTDLSCIESSFFNINTAAELAEAEAQIPSA